jgi:hypothetical protein
MLIEKVTHGYVVQRFDTETGQLVSQNFKASCDCDYEDTNGNPLDEGEDLDIALNLYHPFDMIQPDNE